MDITIDGRPLTLEKPVTVLEAARLAGVDIPTLCWHPRVSVLGACRLCMIEVVGMNRLLAACTTRVADKMEIKTDTPALRGPLTDPNIPKAGHHLKYDYIVMARHGLKVAPLSFDTMIAEWLINPISRNLGLKNLAWVRLNYRMTEIEELIGKGKNQKEMKDVHIAEAAAYAAADAAIWVTNLRPKGKDFELALDARLDTSRWLEVSGTLQQGRGLQWLDSQMGTIRIVPAPKEQAEEARIRVPPGPPPEVIFSTPTEGETDVGLSTRVRVSSASRFVISTNRVVSPSRRPLTSEG